MQATMTMNNSSIPSLRILFVMAFMIALAVLSAHAIAKHGSDALVAAQCRDNPTLRMVNMETGRIAHICATERGWGIYILAKDGQNVTAFIKEKMSCIEQVIKYLQNRGYTIIQ